MAIRVGAYSRPGIDQPLWPSGWALIEGQAFINLYGQQGGRLFKARHLSTFMAIRVGAYSRLGMYQPLWLLGWALIQEGQAFINLMAIRVGAY